MSIVTATVVSTDQKMGYQGLVRGHAPVVLDYVAPYGDDQGPGPMEMLLMAVGTCTASGVGLLLRKMHKSVTSITVKVTGDRAETSPTVFRSIVLDMVVHSPDATDEELLAVVARAESTICPVYIMLSQSIPITANPVLSRE